MRSIAPLPPRLGEMRRDAGFLFFPKTIGRETRWLEWAVWDDIWTERIGPMALPVREWRHWAWVNR